LEVTLRTQRITAGCWRIAIIAGLIIALPVFFGLWSLVALGHPPPRYVYVFLIVGLGAYIAVTSLEWIIAAFMGEDDLPSAGQPVTAATHVTPASAPAAPVPASPVVASSPTVAPSATAASTTAPPPATASPDTPPAPPPPADPLPPEPSSAVPPPADPSKAS
jgi:hypothetical protein